MFAPPAEGRAMAVADFHGEGPQKKSRASIKPSDKYLSDIFKCFFSPSNDLYTNSFLPMYDA